jgi:hypothetical protein
LEVGATFFEDLGKAGHRLLLPWAVYFLRDVNVVSSTNELTHPKMPA